MMTESKSIPSYLSISSPESVFILINKNSSFHSLFGIKILERAPITSAILFLTISAGSLINLSSNTVLTVFC